MNPQMKNLFTSVKNAIHGTNEPLENPDFDIIFELAVKQSLLPIVYEGCFEDVEFKKYNDRIKVMDSAYSVLSFQSKRTEAFDDIYSKFLENGIKPLILKGLLCRSLYGELSDHRASSDEDILIQPKDYEIAEKTLIDNGFIIEDGYVARKNLSKVQEVTFFNQEKKLSIELHFNFTGGNIKLLQKINNYFDNVFDDVVTFEYDGKIYYTLEYTKNYIYLFFHLCKHFITSGVGLRQIIDLMMFEKIYSRYIDWNKVENVLKDISLWGLYGDVIAIGNKYLGFEFSRGESIDPEMLIDDIEQSGIFGNLNTSQFMSSAFITAAFDHNKKSSRFRMLFPPLEVMRHHDSVLCDKQWLLPFVWGKRIIKYIPIFFSTRKRSVIIEADKIAQKRIQLLKKYNINM
ncbi:MAG: nucleotidyltransferase family protein [Ruminococcus sp.]|nr:nucleotidyltransferase family protein [Ruminococcus sp.]